MTVTFRQKQQKAKTSYLYADIMFCGNRIKYSLGISIPSNTFDIKKQVVKGKENIELNNLLSRYKTIIYKVMREMQLDDINTPQQLRAKLNISLRNVEEEKTITELVEFAKMHFKRVGRVLKMRTILSNQTTINKIIDYQTKHNKVVTFEDVNYEFYHSFLDYCRTDLELATNTIGNHIKNIKAWMNVATEEGLNTNLTFRNKGFKMIREKVETIYLNLEELELIRKLDLKGSHLDRVRDIFLVGCFTGVRIGDYHKINFTNMINDNSLLKISTEKTGEEVIIPVHPFVYQALTKYNGSIPMLSHQKFNKYIKEVVRLAGINEEINITQTKGNKVINYTSPKYELVSSHCARRSFATNAFKSGVPSLSIMQITGHTTEKNFLKYIRVTKEENARLIAVHSFFNTQTHLKTLEY